ncbi:BON domain-containing protein [Alginatibacterium sediminis]|uniref:BON domain-containing protein n=1 Tax=Alginatibacterium sediminis TaxID=2164068 RepID=A0A420E8U8_9ALTE|nr:BON domain-containing protein [Alginatibacterium sediminis]RKF15899.1 BON domain-containing protein [Alginatibacterium sediminis]
MTPVKTFFIISSLVLLQACAGVAVVGAGVAAGAATDRRSVGTQFDDQLLELNSVNALAKDEDLWEVSRLSAHALNSKVLVIGQTQTVEHQARVSEIIAGLDGVSQVLNEVRVQSVAPLDVQSKDAWITSQVKLKIYDNNAIPVGKIKVITEDSEVFLIGLVNRTEADAAVEIARHVGGVTAVIRVFDYVQE